jgi:hypothetical protein
MQAEIFNSSCDIHFAEKYHHGMLSIFKNLAKIRREEGFLALYKGLPPTLIGIIHPLVFFPCYEKLKIHFKEQQTNPD